MADSYILNLFFEWILYQNYHTILFVIFVFEKLSQNLYFIFPGLAFKGTKKKSGMYDSQQYSLNLYFSNNRRVRPLYELPLNKKSPPSYPSAPEIVPPLSYCFGNDPLLLLLFSSFRSGNNPLSPHCTPLH